MTPVSPSQALAGGAGLDRRWLIAGLVLGVLIALVGLLHLRSERQAARIAAGSQLAAIADLKAEQVAAWRDERLAEARFILRAPGVSDDIAAFVAQPGDTIARARVLGWLNPIKGGDRYESVSVFDPKENRLLAVTDAGTVDPVVAPGRLAQALVGDEVVFTDLQRAEGSAALTLDLLVPIRRLPVLRNSPGRTVPVAVVVLRLNPRKYLFPLIESWRVPQATTTVSLVRREGDTVVFLNDLPQQPGSALTLRCAIGEKTLPVALALRGEPGGHEGINRSGAPVIFASRAIPGSGWMLVAEIDQGEIFAPIRRLAWLNLSLLALLFLAVGLAGALLARRQQMLFLQETLAARQDSHAVAARLALITQHAHDAILLFDENMQIVEANQSALTVYGRTAEEMREMSVFDLCEAQPSEKIAEDYAEVLATGDGVVVERKHRRKDGSLFPVEISARAVEVEGRGHLLAIIRDITGRKLTEDRIRHSEASLASTLQSIGDGVIATDESGLIMRMNPAAERLTGWKLADARGHALAEVFCAMDIQTREPRPEPVQQVMTRGKTSGPSKPATLLARDGRECQVSSHASPMLDAAGRMMGVVLVFSDITEKYRAQQELATMAGMLERTGEMAKIGGWELDLRTMTLFWSSETCRIHEWNKSVSPTLDEAIRLYAADLRPAVLKALQACIDCRQPFDLDLPVLTASGRSIWVRVQGFPVMDGAKTVMLQGAMQDITERKQEEEALRETEARNRALLDAIPDLIFTNRRTGEFLSVQASDPGALFAPPESFHHRRLERVLPAAVAEQFLRAFGTACESGTMQVLCYALPIGGEDKYFEARIVASGPDTVVSIIRDITQRKQTEDRLRKLSLIVEQAPLSVVITDLSGAIEYANPKFYAVTGYTPAEVLGKNPRLVNSGETAPEVFQDLWQTITRGEVWCGEFRNRRKNGETFLETAVIAPVVDAQGRTTHYVAMQDDVSAQKRFEAEALAMLKKEREVSELKTRFISVTSHEFRTPMAAIMGSVEILANHLDRLAPAKRRELFDRINTSLRRLTEMLDQVLLLSRVDARRMIVNYEPVDLPRFLRGFLEEIRLGDRSGHQFEIRVASEVTGFVSDPQLLRPILLHLLNNAMRFSAAGTAITLHLKANEAELQLAIEDQGIGVPEADRVRIFEPFERGSNVGQIGGSGLGLNVVKRMAGLLGGTIAVTHGKSGGSRFVLTLPLQPLGAFTQAMALSHAAGV